MGRYHLNLWHFICDYYFAECFMSDSHRKKASKAVHLHVARTTVSLHCLTLGLDQFSAVCQGLVYTDLHHLAFLQCIVPGFYTD